MFGYADMSEEGPDYQDIENFTPFMKFNGKAKLENKTKFNYFKKLNEIAFERRMKKKDG